MKKILYMAFFLVGCIIVSSCSDDEVITQQPIVRDTQTDMQVLSRYIDINESTNEYYINENKKTRALSYVTGADWKELEKVTQCNLPRAKIVVRSKRVITPEFVRTHQSDIIVWAVIARNV